MVGPSDSLLLTNLESVDWWLSTTRLGKAEHGRAWKGLLGMENWVIKILIKPYETAPKVKLPDG